MARIIEVLTPENISITMEPAGIATRLGAVLVDIMIQLGIAVAGGIIGGLLSIWFQWISGTSMVTALLIIGGFILLFGYFILFETIWNGQTPGKKLFGIRVVRDGGRPVDFFAVATRNLVRIADFLPVAYSFGLTSMFFSSGYKRLGDHAAGTIVVRERDARTLGFAWGKKREDIAKAAAAQFKSARLPETANAPADLLSTREKALLRRFSLRRWEMTPDDAERMGYRIIVPLVARLNLSFVPGAPPEYANLVSVIVAELDRAEEEREASNVF